MKQYHLETSWADTVIKYPKLIIMMSIIIVLLLGLGLRYVTMSSDYRYFFGEDNPQIQNFENLQNVYSKDDSVLVSITPKDGIVFKQETLKAIQYLTEHAWKLSFVTRVDSLTNFQHSYAEKDDLIVKDLVNQNDVSRNDYEHFKFLKDVALNEPLLIDRLINDQASVAGVNIKMTFPGESPFEVPAAAQEARDLADAFRVRFPGHAVHLTGMVMLNDAFNEAGIRDVMTLIPIMYLLIAVLLFVILKSKAGVAATLSVMIMSIIGAMGFSGWMSIPITPPSSISPTVIMTLAIAHSIHILKTMTKSMNKGMDRYEAITESLKQNLKPVFLTSLTTMVGFLSLNFSDTPPFHDLGNITAIGVALSFVLAIGFLPAVMSRASVAHRVNPSTGTDITKRYAERVEKHAVAIVVSMIFGTTFLGAQIQKMEINDQFVGYFDESIQFRPHSEYIIENMTGVYQLNFDIQSGTVDGISDPAYLETLDAFSSYLRTLPGVVHVSSISDTFKRLNMNMHGDDESAYTLPKQKDLAAQYLLLYEMSLPYGLDLNNQIAVDKSATRLVVTLSELTTSEILEVADSAAKWLRVNAPKEMYAEATSPTVMFSHITDRNIQSMLWGTLIALSLITAVMMIALRSFTNGLISLLPNVVPATISIGLWAILVGEAGFSIAFVASVTLGIIVDDTVHFLSKFNYAKNNGLDSRDSVQYAISHVGSALISTSAILVVGFSVLMLSGFKLNFVLGALSALTITVALVVDFTFLPALLHLPCKLKASSGAYMKTKFGTYSIGAAIAAVSLSFSMDSALANGLPESLSTEQKGRWVAESADNYDSGFINQSAHVLMELKNSNGQIARRQLRIKMLEVEGDGDKSLTIFDTPYDVKGTAFLSYSHTLEPDDQWLYLPSLKRVKRISSNNKSGPFMGSEFAYEDLSSQEVDKYTYRYIDAVNTVGGPGHLVERTPVDKNSGYARQLVWVDEEHWRGRKIEFYDRKNLLLKTLVYEDYQQYPNGKWRADRMVMVNHQTGKSTTLYWNEIAFGLDFTERDFNKNALKRVK